MSLVLQQGALVAGRYRVARCIATGAMGAVYEVLHLETERRRALKVMHPNLADSEELRNRFKLEARIAARVESDFIVEVFDAGIDDATRMPFLVMELLRGEELGKRLKRVGRFSPDDAVAYLEQTALALDKTHRAAIVHRDLKPSNLFLTHRDDGMWRVKVLDFGVAKLIAEASASAGATASLGTPFYMAPEQFRGGAVSPASDIFSLGMIAYTFLVGRPYWAEAAKGRGNAIAFAMVASKGPQEPATACAARAGVVLPPAFDPWFAQMTAHAPEARFQSATAAVAALAEALGLPPLLAPPPSSRAAVQVGPGVGDPPPSGTSRAAFSASAGSAPPARRARRLWIAAAAAFVLLGGAAAYALHAGGAAPGARPEEPAGGAPALSTTADSPPVPAPTIAPATSAPPPVSSALSPATSEPAKGQRAFDTSARAHPPAPLPQRPAKSTLTPIYSPD
jgi:serine/threonine-protein kinase